MSSTEMILRGIWRSRLVNELAELDEGVVDGSNGAAAKIIVLDQPLKHEIKRVGQSFVVRRS